MTATNETIQVINNGTDPIRLSIQILSGNDYDCGWVEQSTEDVAAGATSSAHWVATNHKRVVITSEGS